MTYQPAMQEEAVAGQRAMTDHKNIRMKDSIESFGRKPVYQSKNTSIEVSDQYVVENVAN